MRANKHYARKGKNGIFSAKHNDRNYDYGEDEHIIKERTNDNLNWHWYMDEPGGADMTFEQAEQRYYEEYLSAGLNARNERYRKQRHPERCKTIDEYRVSAQGCVEEEICTIGNMKESVPDDLLKKIVMEQVQWEQRMFPNVVVLDISFHTDEAGVNHFHNRRVWVAHDDEGNLIVGQAKALAEMGIGPPDPSKKYGRHNNAKMTYTKLCREHFLQVCKEHGLEIETEPQEASKSGLSQLEYKRQQEEQRLAEAREQRKQEQEATQHMRQQQKTLSDDVERLLDTKYSLQAEGAVLGAKNAEMRKAKDNLEPYLKAKQYKPAEKSFVGKVILDINDYNRLSRQAQFVEESQNALNKLRESERIIKQRDSIIATARATANRILTEAQKILTEIKERKRNKSIDDVINNAKETQELEILREFKDFVEDYYTDYSFWDEFMDERRDIQEFEYDR